MSDDTDENAPDETVHENSLLASAYLDGEATVDERALVETSPDTLAEVAALTQVRTVLAATAPVASLSEREAHLAGALDVWERMSDLERSGEATPAAGVDAAAAAALTTPVSSSQGRRGRPRRTGSRRSGSVGASQWFLGAAATLVVVAGAAAVLRGIVADDDGGGSDQAAIEAVTDDGSELSEVEANEAAEVNGEDVGADVVPDPDLIADEAQSDPASDATDDADDGGLFPADETMQQSTASADAESAPAADEQPPPAAESDRSVLETPEELADYGLLAVRFVDGNGPLPTVDFDAEPPPDSCEGELGLERRLLPIVYRGQNVNVGVDVDRDIVLAYTDECTVVESVPLPIPPTTTQP